MGGEPLSPRLRPVDPHDRVTGVIARRQGEGAAPVDGLGAEILELRDRIVELERIALEREPAELEAALEGLRVSLEELRVAHEALRRRHDEDVRALRERLEHERARTREWFEEAPACYLVTDEAGVVLEANTAAAELLNVRSDTLAGKSLASFVVRDGRRDLRRLLLRLEREGVAPEEQLTLKPRGGDPVLVRAVAGAETPRRLRWTLRRRDERRNESAVSALAAELETGVDARGSDLELERARLESVLEQMPSAVVIVEAPSGRLVLGNAQAARLGLTGEAAYTGYRPDGAPYAPDEWPLARSVAVGEVVSDERIELVYDGGSRATIEVSSAPVRRPQGDIAAAVAIVHDVTSRERREGAERDFVINAAHELQTPLTAITSAVEVLQAGAKEIPEDRDRFLAHVQDECDRLARLVRSLLQLARAEMGEEHPSRQAVPVRPMLEDVAERVRPRPGVRLEVRCPPRLRAHTNRELAEQALINLVGNAVKYTTGGRISLSARSLDAACLVLEVADTGPGIPVEVRDRVFERFYRGGGRSRDGFGLGLAIAARTAEVLDGRLELDEGGGSGTTMRLILPRKAA